MARPAPGTTLVMISFRHVPISRSTWHVPGNASCQTVRMFVIWIWTESPARNPRTSPDFENHDCAASFARERGLSTQQV